MGHRDRPAVLYRLISRSKLPSAEKFKAWVMGEILPFIRKTGCYTTAPQIEDTEHPRKTRYIEGVTREYKAALRSATAVILNNSMYL